MRRLAVVLVAAAIASSPAEAALFRSHVAKPVVSETSIAQIQRAIDEQRLLDAGRMLDESLVSGAADSRLALLSGELNLAKGQYETALTAFREAERDPSTLAHGLEGEGVALALMNRADEALPVLKKAVAQDAGCWRAWNALGSIYDEQSNWTEANGAYEQAVQASGGAAIVLNNRGYSRLLQHQRDQAIDDFVEALRKRPDLAEARTNLRLALAMGGDYDRAVSGGDASEQAALLNNAGFAAGMRGDYAKAQELLDKALSLKGQYYARASENLKIIKALAAQDASAPPHAAE